MGESIAALGGCSFWRSVMKEMYEMEAMGDEAIQAYIAGSSPVRKPIREQAYLHLQQQRAESIPTWDPEKD
jgi:hypothetical protein